jgi:hypothetical protein
MNVMPMGYRCNRTFSTMNFARSASDTYIWHEYMADSDCKLTLLCDLLRLNGLCEFLDDSRQVHEAIKVKQPEPFRKSDV